MTCSPRLSIGLTWQPQRQLPLVERLIKVGSALLSLKEIEYFGHAQAGAFGERLSQLIDRLLGPLETEWFGKVQMGHAVAAGIA